MAAVTADCAFSTCDWRLQATRDACHCSTRKPMLDEMNEKFRAAYANLTGSIRERSVANCLLGKATAKTKVIVVVVVVVVVG